MDSVRSPRYQIDCRCQRQPEVGVPELTAQKFRELWDHCPAVRCLLVPAQHLDKYLDACMGTLDEAHHSGVAYLAVKRGGVKELCGLLHRYCLQGSSLSPRLTQQYRRDLAETWLLQDDYQARARRANCFMGRVMELAVAYWMENNGWALRALEAWGSQADICATTSDGEPVQVEVKTIGHDARLLQSEVEALAHGGVSVGTGSLYSPLDYLLVRISEACGQLRRSQTARRAVAVVLEDYDENYRMQLEEDWIDWASPRFFASDADVADFLEDQRRKCPDMDDNLRTEVRVLDEIWFFSRESTVGLRLEGKVDPRRSGRFVRPR